MFEVSSNFGNPSPIVQTALRAPSATAKARLPRHPALIAPQPSRFCPRISPTIPKPDAIENYFWIHVGQYGNSQLPCGKGRATHRRVDGIEDAQGIDIRYPTNGHRIGDI